MKNYYKIVDSILCIKSNNDIDLSFFKDFEVEEIEPNVEIQVVPISAFSTLIGKDSEEIYGVYHYSSSFDSYKHVCMTEVEGTKAFLAANKDWSKCILGFEEYFDTIQDMPPWGGLILTAFYSHIVSKDVLLIHASAVSYNDKGLIFTGPSNIGKTTQAKLWNQYLNAEILNGDKLFIKIKNNHVYVYGNPWRGSSPYYLNKSVIVNYVVALQKGEENSLVELSDFEKMLGVVPHVFLPHWDAVSTNQAASTLDFWLTHNRFYKLTCRPNQEAVELVKNTLFD